MDLFFQGGNIDSLRVLTRSHCEHSRSNHDLCSMHQALPFTKIFPGRNIAASHTIKLFLLCFLGCHRKAGPTQLHVGSSTALHDSHFRSCTTSSRGTKTENVGYQSWKVCKLDGALALIQIGFFLLECLISQQTWVVGIFLQEGPQTQLNQLVDLCTCVCTCVLVCPLLSTFILVGGPAIQFDP